MRLAIIRYRNGISAALVTDTTAAPVRLLPGRDHAIDVRSLIISPFTRQEHAALADHAVALDQVEWL